MEKFTFVVVIALLCNVFIEVLAQDGCPRNEYPVSILGDSQNFRCVSVLPCSGKYKTSGMQPVGGCPPGTGCALLPNKNNIMGCVDAGRTDVTYVLPDGTLSFGPLNPISEPTLKPSTGPNTDSSTGGDSSPGSPSSSSNSSSSISDARSTDDSGSAGSNIIDSTSSKISDSKPLNATDPASSSVGTKKKDEKGGFNLTSIIFIVVGVLAVVAVITGIRLLKRRKEPEDPIPTPAEHPYGAGNEVMTPKENVLLL